MKPLLDPHRWTRRHTCLGVAGFVIAGIAALIETSTASPAHGLGAFAGALIGVGLILLASSLPRVSLAALYIGGSVTSAAILAWTHPDRPVFVWSVQLLQIVVLLVWTFPWLPYARLVAGLGSAWTGGSYWVLGVAGAFLTALARSDGRYAVVAAQRLAYLALAAVTILALVKASRASENSASIGLTAAFLMTLGVLFVLGSGNVFEPVHAAPRHTGGAYLENRFWGGAGIYYHPVSMAGIAVAAGLRVALDRSFTLWQRLATAAVGPFVIVVTMSRTAAVLMVAAIIVTLAMGLGQRLLTDLGRLITSLRSRVLGVAMSVLLVAGIAIAAGPGIIDFFTVSRYRDSPVARAEGRADDITSGRVATWRQVLREFRSDGWSEKLLGSAERSRATVLRPGDWPDDPGVHTDNAVVGALRRGGLLGLGAFIAGLVVLVVHAIRSGSVWFSVATLASLATIPTTDWLLGSPLWHLLLSGEAAVLLASAARQRSGAPPPRR